MPIVKKGKCDSSVVSSSTIYVCNDCGHTEMANSSESKKCPKCEVNMVLVSSSASSASSSGCGCGGGKCSI
jgi:Zn finger protein HypA/HybF involved in hydrogenase expression